jgi:hypothetical protein
LPQRTAEKKLHSHRDQIARWFRELEHYGFVVLTSKGHLGVHGLGRAPCWRLTELPYKNEPPTKDFLAWNGGPFGSQKTESRPGIQGQGKRHQRKFPLAWKTGPMPLARKTGPNLDLLSIG